jgi:hypothetical protein
MQLTSWLGHGLAPLFATALSLSAALITPQTDTFTTGAQNWANGVNAPDPVTAFGGPGGAADSYLQITGDGAGSGGRMTAFNRVQWAGDYSNIAFLSMDVLNTNTFTLNVRVAMKLATTNAAQPGISSNAITVAPDGQWHHLVFTLVAGNFTGLNGGTFASIIPNVAELRVLNAATPRLNGDQLAGILAVDNISATAIPEPATFGMLAGGLCAGLLLRKGLLRG